MPTRLARVARRTAGARATRCSTCPRSARRVRIPIRNLSPQVQRLDVTVDDRPADLRQLPSGPWITLDYHLPPQPDRRWHAIHLRVSPTWQAPGDGRVLGVVIGEWGYQ